MIKLEDVYKSYGAIRVIESLSLQVEDGNSLCLLGKSGCGKSTLLKLIALITKADRGKVMIDGKEINEMSDAEIDEIRKEKISYSFQEPLLIPYINTLENVIEVTGAPKEKATEILTQLGLGDRLYHRPQKLSGGEKKRVDIARAILRNRQIIVADEPLSYLDPETSRIVVEMLKAHVERGGVLVYSSVDPAAAKFATHVMNMEKK